MRQGEIDIIAVRGRRLAIVEVKARDSLSKAAEAITPRQQKRLRQATSDFLARHPHYAHHVIGFDVMLVVRRRWPLHIVDAWRDHES